MQAGWLGWHIQHCQTGLTSRTSACLQFCSLHSNQPGCLHRCQVQGLYQSRTTSAYHRRPVLTAAAPDSDRDLRHAHTVTLSSRQHGWKRQVSVAAFKRAKPNDSFSEEAVRRIEKRGPSEQDVERTVVVTQESGEFVEHFDVPYTPPNVLGKVEVAQPRWGRLHKMTYREFFYGLQQRNWKSKHFDAEASPWNLQFFSCKSKGLLSFDGYRVQITKADGSKWWCDLPLEGTEVYVQDNLRTKLVPGHDDQINHIRRANPFISSPGYKQVFEQLFQAYDQYMPEFPGYLKDAEFRARLAKGMGWQKSSAAETSLAPSVKQAKGAVEAEAVAEEEASSLTKEAAAKQAAALEKAAQEAQEKDDAWQEEAAVMRQDASVGDSLSGRIMAEQLDPASYVCPGADLLHTTFHTAVAYSPFTLLPTIKFSWDVAIGLFYLTFLFIVLFFSIITVQDGGDMYSAREYAQSKESSRKEGMTDVTLADVAGLDNLLDRLQQVVAYLKDPEGTTFKMLTKPPKGILLEGPPGVGKTLIAKAVAGEAGVPFYQMSGSEFMEVIIGVGAARVRDLFKRARSLGEPCIIFVDEIDAIGLARQRAGGKEEQEQTLNQLLVEMDGFKSGSGVLVMAATNRFAELDQALVRPGRFDWAINIEAPNRSAREAILKVHSRSRKMAADVNLSQVAADTPGLSGAELANLLNEATLLCVRRGETAVTSADLYNALDRNLRGIQWPQLPEDSEVRKLMAVYEVGKGMVSLLLRDQRGWLDEVERVNVIPKGREWTLTTYFRDTTEENLLSTRGMLMDRLRVLLAGRAAEEVAIQIPTTMSIVDIKDASRLALKMVSNYGFSDLGVITFGENMDERTDKSYRVALDTVERDLDRGHEPYYGYMATDYTKFTYRFEAYKLVNEAYEANVALLNQHREALRHAAFECNRVGSLTGKQLREIMEKYPPRTPTHPFTSSENFYGISNGRIGSLSPDSIKPEAALSDRARL